MQRMFVWMLVLAICGCGSLAKKPHDSFLQHLAQTPHDDHFRELMPRAVYGSGPRNVLGSPGQLTTNADMVVVCTRNGHAIKKWEGQARWDGKLPDRFEAAVRQGRILSELEIDPAQVRLEVNSDGSGGVTLDKWVDPRADRVILIVRPAGTGMDEGVLGKAGASGDEGEGLEGGLDEVPAQGSKDGQANAAQPGQGSAAQPGQGSAAQPGQGSGAHAVEELTDAEARDILRASPAGRRQKIGAWVERQAKRQAGQTLAHLWNHPSQAAMEMAKGLSPIRQAEGVLHDLSAAADGQSEGWSRLASAFGTAKRVSGFGATLAGSLALFTQIGILAIPGVNVAYLTSITIAAGLVALTAASLEAQAAQEAAVKAKTPVELRERMRRSADAQTEVFLGTLMVAVPAAVSAALTRIGLPERLQALGRTLHAAERELARGAKPPVGEIRARVRDSLVKARAGLKSAFGREVKAQQTAIEHVKALSPDELVDKLAQGDEMLKKATGLSAEHAKAIQRLGNSERGRGFASELHKTAIRTLTHALSEVQAQGRALMSSLDEAIARLKGAGSRQALQAAVAWARSELDRERIAFQTDNRILASGRRLMTVDDNTPLAMSAVSGGGPGGKVPAGTGGGGSGTGGGNSGKIRKGVVKPPKKPGKWVRVNRKNSMSAEAAEYQEQITGRPITYEYEVGGVKFDGYKDGVLLDAKHRYLQFTEVENGDRKWQRWYESSGELARQAERQAKAAKEAGGIPIEWHIAEKEMVALFQAVVEGVRATDIITVKHVPKR